MQTFENETLNSLWKKNHIYFSNAGRKVYAEVLNSSFDVDGKLILDMTHQSIADATGVHKQSVYNTFKDMLAMGLVKKVKRLDGRYAMNTYEVTKGE